LVWLDILLYMTCVAVGVLVGMEIEEHLKNKILILKANRINRTPEKIGDSFYYIVPESEYVKKWYG